MFTFIGVLLIIFGAAMFMVYPHLRKEDEGGNFGKKKSSPFLLMFKRPVSIVIILLGLFISLLNGLFFYAERGHQYLLVYPNGATDAVMKPGIKAKFFAKIDPWQKFIDVKAVEEGQNSNLDEIEGVMKPIGIRFIDQVTARGVVSIRFELPKDKEDFIKMAIKFRTMENLVYNTLIPTVSEQLKNTGYMFAAQNYISGEAQSFRQTFEETLKGGTFVVEKNVLRDTLFAPIRDNQERLIKEIRTTYKVEKVLENGLPKRIPHEITENNIIVSQVIVDDIGLEGAFKERLQKQRDESAKRQLEQQMTETAKSEQQRILAQGERDKAQERVNQEKEQVKTLIAIETQVKKEESNKALAAIALETERLLSQKRKVAADAKKYELLQADGLSEEEKYKMDIDLQKTQAIAGAIKDAKWPTTVVQSGDSKGGSNLLETLIGADLAKKFGTNK